MKDRAVFLTIAFGMALAFGAGCTKHESGYCPPPLEDLQWVYIIDSNGLMTQKSCVLCDASVAPEGYAAWANENAANAISAGNATPCLYVYPGEPRDWESKSECTEMACSEDPEGNDGVSKTHGAWRVVREILGAPSEALNEAGSAELSVDSVPNAEPD